jgi:hypothetical protein
MSSQLATLVPVFDRTNYLVWSRAMKAYLQSQGLFGYTVSRSHKGAAGMRSVLTFVKVVWIVDARVER